MLQSKVPARGTYILSHVRDADPSTASYLSKRLGHVHEAEDASGHAIPHADEMQFQGAALSYQQIAREVAKNEVDQAESEVATSLVKKHSEQIAAIREMDHLTMAMQQSAIQAAQSGAQAS